MPRLLRAVLPATNAAKLNHPQGPWHHACCCACLQVFIEGKAGQTGDELERQLFIARKLIEQEKVRAAGLACRVSREAAGAGRASVAVASTATCS